MIVRREQLYDILTEHLDSEYSIGLHGIDYNRLKGNAIKEEKLKEFKIPKDQNFHLEFNEFLYIYFYLE